VRGVAVSERTDTAFKVNKRERSEAATRLGGTEMSVAEKF